MDDFAAPVTGTYPDAPRLPLITMVEAREAVRLLMRLAEAGDGDSEEELDAYALATDIATRLPSCDGRPAPVSPAANESWAGMASIRTHTGTVHLCASCGQPSFDGEVGLQHFHEQWDGVHCPYFPLAGARITIAWDGMSLKTLRQQYPDTYPK